MNVKCNLELMGLNMQSTGALSNSLNQISEINVQFLQIRVELSSTLVHLHVSSHDQRFVGWTQQKKQISRGEIQDQFLSTYPSCQYNHS